MRLRNAIAAVAAGLTLLVLAGCANAGASPKNGRVSPELRVAAAATLRQAFEELAPTFERKNGANITFDFGASGMLQRQIEGGAPVDVFASAGAKQMDALLAESLVDSATVAPFASNRLALVVPANSTLALTGFRDLVSKRVVRVATGNPESAPHGATAFEVLDGLGLLDALRPKLVLTQNAGQTFDYVARGEVSAALVYVSEATGRSEVKVVSVADPSLHKPIRYEIGVTTGAPDSTLATAFVTYITSAEGRAVLKKHGFVLLQ